MSAGFRTGSPLATGPLAPAAFSAEVRAAVVEHSDTWASHCTSSVGDSSVRGLAPHWDADALRAAVLPPVREGLRIQVDAKMRAILQDLKASTIHHRSVGFRPQVYIGPNTLYPE